ncbi:hypothetical protein IJT93_03670 [bacterium]|nr:hypothetical protein [bacterium]
MNNKGKHEAGGAPAAGAKIDIERFTGVSKLIVQVSRGVIEPETFLQEIYAAFKDIDGRLRDVKKQLSGFEAEAGEYVRKLGSELDSCAYLFRLALMQFEAFVNREEPSGLRIGTQIAEKAQEVFRNILERVRAAAEQRDFSEKKDIISALAAETVSRRRPLEEYRRALKDLKAVFLPLEEESRRLREETVKNAKELVDYEDDSEELKKRGAEIMPKLARLADACGLLVLAAYSPDYVRQAVSTAVMNEEIKDSDGPHSS